MSRQTFLFTIFLFVSLIFGVHPYEAHCKKLQLIKPGNPFPEVPLQVPSDSGERNYLGLKPGEFFTLKDIKADVVLVEIMSVYCPSCQRQVRPYNELFDLIENSASTKGRIKIIGIAVGNSEVEIEDFNKKYKVKFPIVPDPNFAMHSAIGGSRTPFSIYVRQDKSDWAGVVADTHLGRNRNYKKLFSELTELMDTDLAAIRKESKQKEAEFVVVKPVLSETEIQEKVKSLFTSFDGKVSQFEKVNLKSVDSIYTCIVEHEGKSRRLFARATSRPPTCDVCHDIHFIYVFDSSGEVLKFEPIQVTKRGNKPWDESDVAQMRERILGRYIAKPYLFNPEVDAVSSATITSAVIIDAVFKGEKLLEEMKEKGLIRGG